MSKTTLGSRVRSAPRARTAAIGAVAVSLALAGGSAVFAASSPAKSPQSAPTAAKGKSFTDAVEAETCFGGRHKATVGQYSNDPQLFDSDEPESVFEEALEIDGPRRGTDLLVLTFTAEAQLRGGRQFDWLEVVLTVDGEPVTDDGSSSPLAFTGSPYYGSHATQACYRVRRGEHEVEVFAYNNRDRITSWLDDAFLRVDVLD